MTAKAYVCSVCGGATHQASIIVDDRLYRSCCWTCTSQDKWQGVSVGVATERELAEAIRVTEADRRSPDATSLRGRSIQSALVQWAGEVLSEHRGMRQRPEGCRAWGS